MKLRMIEPAEGWYGGAISASRTSAPTKEGYESSGDLPQGYSAIVYPRENACQAFFVRVIVIFCMCVTGAGMDWVGQQGEGW